MKPNRSYEFGPFRLEARERLLLRDGKPVALTRKAFDTLLILVENRGHLLTKDELMRGVWPDVVVEEIGLARNISSLRKVLGDRPNQERYIATIAGSGYRFVATLQEPPEDPKGAEEESSVLQGIRSLPAQNDYRQEARHGVMSRPSPMLHRWRWAVLATAAILIGLGGFLLYQRTRPTQPQAEMHSIAVLPFRSLDPGTANPYLGLGMADALITRLSNIQAINVLPTSVVRPYAALEQDPIITGRALKVDSMLIGGVQKDGDNIRVTVQLVRVRDGQSLWADKFDRKFTDVFVVQDSISEAIAGAFIHELGRKQRQQLARHYTDNAEAYRLYLEGQYHWNKRTADDVKKALILFQQAITQDPRYALAYEGMSRCYAIESYYGGTSPAGSFLKAKAAALKALEIDDSLAEAHASLGWVRMNYDRDWRGAEREFQTAIQLDPKNATAHHWHGLYLLSQGSFDQAVAEVRHAGELDPLSLVIRTNLGLTYYFARRYDEAVGEASRALELDAAFSPAHRILAFGYTGKREFRKAIAEWKSAGLGAGDLAHLGWTYAVSGGREQALNVITKLNALSRQRYISPYYFARIYAELGDTDDAFKFLEQAFNDRNEWFAMTKVDPAFDGLRSDPRFADLLRRCRLAS